MSLRGLARGGLAAWLACLVVATIVTFAAKTKANELRPYDAPRTPSDAARVPARPVEYEVKETDGMAFAYHPAAYERIRPLIARADRLRSEVTNPLGEGLLAAIEVRVAPVPAEMTRLSPAEVPGYAKGVAFSDHRLIVMSLVAPLTREPPDLETVFRHEMAHLALDEALGGRSVPRWFHEGLAVHLAGEDAVFRAEILFAAALEDGLPRLSELDADFPAEAPEGSVAWAEAADFARFLLDSSRAEHFATFLEAMRAGSEFESALSGAYGADMASIERAFRQDLARRYGFVPVFLCAAALGLLAFAVVIARAHRRRSAAAVRGEALVDGARTVPARRAKHASKATRIFKSARDDAPGARSSEDGRDRGESATTTRGRRAAKVITVGGREIVERVELEENVPRDLEVPKVEHDGRWHTLH